MNNSFDIRQFFRPTQPSFSRLLKDVSYCEIFPHEKLSNFIYCYWELKSLKSISSDFEYGVVADGCNDIFFELNDPNETYIVGFFNKYTDFSIGKNFHYIGVRFLPGMFSLLFNIDAKELINRSERLEDVSKRTSTFIRDFFSDKDSLFEIKTILDNYFLKILSKTTPSLDSRFECAYKRIIAYSGMIRIEKDLMNELSSRQLRRYFELYIGDTGKTFSKVIRFQKLLNAGLAAQNYTTLYHDFGYYDQSHFIKDFKLFYGTTPSKAFE